VLDLGPSLADALDGAVEKSALEPLDLGALTTEEAVRVALDGVLTCSAQLDGELDELLAGISRSCGARASRLSAASTSAMRSSNSSLRDIGELLRNNAASAVSVSQRVRELDALSIRTKDALQAVDDVISLRKCAERLQAALAAKELDKACDTAAVYLELQARSASTLQHSDAYSALVQLQHGLDVLTDRLRADAEQLLAALGGDETITAGEMLAAVRRLVKVGLREEAASRLCVIVRRAVEKEASAVLEWLDQRQQQGMQSAESLGAGENEAHIAALTAIFETVAAYASSMEDGVVELFGSAKVRVQVMLALQEQCDELSKGVLESYAPQRGLSQLNELMQRVARGTDAERAAESAANLRKMDPLLDEMAIISQRTAAYFDFLAARALEPSVVMQQRTINRTASISKEARGKSQGAVSRENSDLRSPPASARPGAAPVVGSNLTADVGEASESAEFELCLQRSSLRRSVGELAGKYVSLETFFMRENVSKAILMDEAPPETASDNARFSSAADDVFFVLQKCARRALAYRSADTTAAVLGATSEVLARELLRFVYYRIFETDKLSALANPKNPLPPAAVAATAAVKAAHLLAAEGADGGIPSANNVNSSSSSKNAGSSSSNDGKTGAGGTRIGTSIGGLFWNVDASLMSSSSSQPPPSSSSSSSLSMLPAAAAAMGGSGEAEVSAMSYPAARYAYSVALNNAHVAAEYTLKLRAGLEHEALALCRGPRERAQVAQALAQLATASQMLQNAAEEGLVRLADALVATRLRAAEEALARVEYVVSEAEYARGDDSSDEFVQQLISEMASRVLVGLERKLVEHNWDALVRRLAEWVARRLEEAAILPVAKGGGVTRAARRFNGLGALRFDRDVRALSAFFAAQARKSSVRDVFARLSQIALLLNLDSPAELYDIWGSNAGGMAWRLTPSEVRKILLLRVEFSADTIKNLKL